MDNRLPNPFAPPRCQTCWQLIDNCVCIEDEDFLDDDYDPYDDDEEEREEDQPNPMESAWLVAARYRADDIITRNAAVELGGLVMENDRRVPAPRFSWRPSPPPEPEQPQEMVFNRPNIFEECFEPYEKYELKTTPHSVLTPKGVEEVRFWISSRYGINWSYTLFTDWVGLEETIQNHVFEFDGEEFNAGGKIINRLAKILLKRHNTKLTEADKSQLNTLIEPHWVGGESFWIDRATTVDWEAGAFGEKDKKSEDGSCWWYSGGITNSDSRIGRFNQGMQSGLCGALRLWLRNEDNAFHGVGRVWYIRTREGNPILFNGYGLTTIQWAAKLSKLLNTNNYNKVDLAVRPDLIVNNNAGILFDIQSERFRDYYEFDVLMRSER